jgi:hypothetical protein
MVYTKLTLTISSSEHAGASAELYAQESFTEVLERVCPVRPVASALEAAQSLIYTLHDGRQMGRGRHRGGADVTHVSGCDGRCCAVFAGTLHTRYCLGERELERERKRKARAA